MKEYENVIYLDLQKTGSTTIRSVLSALLDEQFNEQKPHGPLPEGFDRSKLFFISVREPLSLYISLFNFGSGNRRGSLYSNLRRKGRAELFDHSPKAFEGWLRFVLNPENANAVEKEYARSTMAETLGLLSFRLLYLSIPKSLQKMGKGKFQNRDDVRRLFQRRVYEDYVRTENLGGDLFAFLNHYSSRLKLREPLTTPEDLIALVPVRNASKKVPGLSPQSVSPELRQLVRDREWLLYEAFGYDTDQNGRPPRLLSSSGAIPAELGTGIGSRPPRGEQKAQRQLRIKARRAQKAAAREDSNVNPQT